MNEVNVESKESLAAVAPQGGIARRRLLRAGMAATPIILTLSGRSAMAAKGDACAKGLSPMAWNSLAPGGTNCLQTSHAVNSSTLGNSPSVWAVNNTWSALGDAKFNSVFGGSVQTQFRNILRINGATTSEVLDADLTAQFSAAYLNVNLIPGYALTSIELNDLYSSSKLGTQTGLSPAQKSAFLKQTW